MSDEDLEQQLRAHYRALDPGSPPREVVESVAEALDATRRPGTTPVRLASAAAGLAAIGLAAAALILGSQPGGFLAGPPGSPTSSVTAPASVAPPTEPPTSSPSGEPSGGAPVDDAGKFGTSGLWVVQGHTLWLSTDYGATWAARTLVPTVALDAASGDVLSNLFVLDANLAWTASPGPGSTVPYSGSGLPYDQLHVVISRTTDGGLTWRSVTLAGDWGGTQPVLTFVDASHGYLLMAGLRDGPGSTLLATSDGGASWQVVGAAHMNGLTDMLGAVFSASDASTLWAGNQGDPGPVARPILDVSRDDGQTWSDARLPGLVGDVYVNDVLLGPPVFSGPAGAVAVAAGSTDNPPDLRFYRTSDGGRTWTLAARLAESVQGTSQAIVVDPTHFVILDPAANQIRTSIDGGRTWQTGQLSGFSLSLRIWFWDPLHGAALEFGTGASAGLIQTSDGGHTWTPISLPSVTPTPSATVP